MRIWAAKTTLRRRKSRDTRRHRRQTSRRNVRRDGTVLTARRLKVDAGITPHRRSTAITRPYPALIASFRLPFAHISNSIPIIHVMLLPLCSSDIHSQSGSAGNRDGHSIRASVV